MKIVIQLFFIFFIINAYAQKAKPQSESNEQLIHQFQVSIVSYMPYPDSLAKHNIPVVAMLKISINEKGAVTNTQLSDSAPPLFFKVFTANQRFLNVQAITTYALHKKLKSTSLIMPVRLYMANDEQVVISALNQSLKFKGVEFTGCAVLLPALDNVFEVKTDY